MTRANDIPDKPHALSIPGPLRGWIRQCLYPAAWRIRVPDGGSQLIPLVRSSRVPRSQTASSARIEQIAATEILDFATEVWIASKRLRAFQAEANTKASRAVRHRIDGALLALADLGLDIRCHEGEPYDVGMALEVLAFDREQGTMRDEIAETVKPTIYFQSRLLQKAHVIVRTSSKSPQQGAGRGKRHDAAIERNMPTDKGENSD